MFYSKIKVLMPQSLQKYFSLTCIIMFNITIYVQIDMNYSIPAMILCSFCVLNLKVKKQIEFRSTNIRGGKRTLRRFCTLIMEENPGSK